MPVKDKFSPSDLRISPLNKRIDTSNFDCHPDDLHLKFNPDQCAIMKKCDGILNALIHTVWTKSEFTSFYVHLHSDDNVPLGYITLSDFRDNFYIEVLAVDKTAQGKGAGGMLLVQAFKFFKLLQPYKNKDGVQLSAFPFKRDYYKDNFNFVYSDGIEAPIDEDQSMFLPIETMLELISKKEDQ